MQTSDDLDVVIEQCHLGLSEFMKGNPEPMKMVYSHRRDVTLANPFGPAVRGWEQVSAAMERAASHYTDGEAIEFQQIAKLATRDLAYTVEVERYRAKVAESEDISQFSLRVTSILRPEEGTWKVVHRHADPIVTTQPAESVLTR